MSNLEDIKTVENELEQLPLILLCKKRSHGVGEHLALLCAASAQLCMRRL